IILGAAIGVVLAIFLVSYPALVVNKPLPLVALAEQVHPLLALSVLLAMLILAVVGVDESFASGLKLVRAMTADGYMPAQFTIRSRPIAVLRLLVILLVTLTLSLLILVPPLLLLSISISCLLLAIVLVNIPDVLRRHLRLPENRWLRMPFHPLVPLLTVVMSITSVLLQPLDSQLATLMVIAAGAVYYVAYGREGAIRTRQDEQVVAVSAIPARKTGYRVLAALADPERASEIILLGRKLAQAQGGILILLRIILADESSQETRDEAQDALRQLSATIDALQPTPDLLIVPQVRVAASAAEGIQATMWEEQIDTVILGWPDIKSNKDERDLTISQVVRHAQAQVIVLRGSWPEVPRRILVPIVSVGHSPAALALAQKLTGAGAESSIVAMGFTPKLAPQAHNQAQQQLDKSLNKLGDRTGIESQIVAAKNAKTGIVEQASEYEVMIIGLSDEGFLAPTEFAGVAVAAAKEISIPALLVAAQEKMINYWLRRTWDQMTAVIPALGNKQQATVSSAMALNARVGIDFHVLITLASAIAFLGLMQNSAAVIIGAMLVAPLMNPILAMAHGIVKGRVNMLREAANTTVNGVIIAITIGIVLTFLLLAFGYPLTPTEEILARTQPNILDLLVALASGAVAAYAISRSEVAGALPGVAIAAALVPPLAVTGYGLGTAQFEIAGGSFLLFITNLAAIVFAAAIVFLLLGFRPAPRVGREEQARFGMKIAIIALLIISIPLLITTRGSSLQTTRDATINNMIENYWPPSRAQVDNIEIVSEGRDELLVNATILDYSGSVNSNSLASLQQQLSTAIGEDVILVAQIINARKDSFDSTRSARELALTPTPTGTMTPTPTSTRLIREPTPSAAPQDPTEPPVPVNTAPPAMPTADDNRTPSPGPQPTETAAFPATEISPTTVSTAAPSTEEPLETATAEPASTPDPLSTETPAPGPTETIAPATPAPS
ncbi:MAG: DUF389 domain-containing protein, partial [Candidatus Promineifilaceae bacterium]|nr:DUF389 domain-containing protein [Candidatus Promineifilaceae bacterium]